MRYKLNRNGSRTCVCEENMLNKFVISYQMTIIYHLTNLASKL